ncbi:MAG: hypothetical protein IJ874_04155 [Ruminococcus sp.]|nr:hypothetical protein [Ruminococcus sp.]
MPEIIFTSESGEPETLEHFLRVKKGVSRRLLTLLKRTPGGITCCGRTIRTVDMVKKGDVIVLRIPEGEPLEPNPGLDIPTAYLSDSVIVFDKPPGVPVHPSHLHHNDTLGNYFSYLYPESTFRPVSRLDRNTSGLCLCALTQHAAGNYRVSARRNTTPQYAEKLLLRVR